VNRGAALIGALLVTLATPTSWPLALGSFLLRGGILLVVLPIVVLPSPVGLANAFGPAVTAIALGSMTAPMAAAGGAVIVAVLAGLLGAGWLAAALEAEAVRIVALEDDVAAIRPGTIRPTSGGIAARILLARLVADLPLVLALAWGSVRLVSITYRELTNPFDVATPIALRVLRATPEVIAAVIVTWLIGEIVGAIAARRIVLDGDGVGRALVGAVGASLRHPVTTLARFLGPTLVLVAVLVLSALAGATAWAVAADALEGPGDPVSVLVTILALVVLWIVGLLLMGVVCAWRAAVWTMTEAARKGTFGGSTDSQPGDWRADPTSATL
jgi:hypothetical protein